MLRSVIVWCLLVPLLCVFAASLVVAVPALAILALSGFCALRIMQWGEEPWQRGVDR